MVKYMELNNITMTTSQIMFWYCSLSTEFQNFLDSNYGLGCLSNYVDLQSVEIDLSGFDGEVSELWLEPLKIKSSTKRKILPFQKFDSVSEPPQASATEIDPSAYSVLSGTTNTVTITVPPHVTIGRPEQDQKYGDHVVKRIAENSFEKVSDFFAYIQKISKSVFYVTDSEIKTAFEICSNPRSTCLVKPTENSDANNTVIFMPFLIFLYKFNFDKNTKLLIYPNGSHNETILRNFYKGLLARLVTSKNLEKIGYSYNILLGTNIYIESNLSETISEKFMMGFDSIVSVGHPSNLGVMSNKNLRGVQTICSIKFGDKNATETKIINTL
jgi:hypothetical protein